MKKLIQILYAIIIIIMFNTSLYSQLPDNWKWLNPNPQGNSLFGLDFADNNVGYSVGAFGTVVKTIDGGNTWSQINAGTNIRLLSVDCINSNIE